MINALVLCGAIPVYVNPEVDNRLGISLGMEVSEVEKAIVANPDAVAVLVNNPTYYGICSDLRSIVKIAHAHNMLVLVDEAHEPICILVRTFRSVPWTQERIWHRFPCISPGEA